MGGGTYSTNTYNTRSADKRAAFGTTFDYDKKVKAAPVSQWKAKDTLIPHGRRESRDSDEHPNSTAVAVLFDVTGSMQGVPRTLQTKMPALLGVLLRKGWIDDPQVLFGAIGDCHSDRVPLQIGQFESDNRMDENLESIFLEGNGGGQKHESYELAMWYMATHTDLDCYEKRGHKGYLFIIGDEMPYRTLNPQHVKDQIGESVEGMSVEEIANRLKEKFEVFFLLPKGTQYGGDTEVLTTWRKLFGENVRELDDPDAVCETIALAIGMCEGITLDDGIRDLQAVGADSDAVGIASKALVNYTPNNSSSGLVAKSDGSLPVATSVDSVTQRL